MPVGLDSSCITSVLNENIDADFVPVSAIRPKFPHPVTILIVKHLDRQCLIDKSWDLWNELYCHTSSQCGQ